MGWFMGLEWVLNPMTSALWEGEKEKGRDIQSEGHVKMEAGIGVTGL
jgi:hypothetical protein